MSEKHDRLLIAATVPETLATILKGQPRYLADYFEISLVTSKGSQISAVQESELLDVIEVPMVRGINPIADVRSIWKMVKVILARKPKLVHSYTPKAGLICMVSAFLCRVPVRVHTFTGLIFPTSRGLKRYILIWVDKLICFCATEIVPEGEGVRRDLLSAGITKKNIQVIGHGNIAGVDTEFFSTHFQCVQDVAWRLRSELAVSESDFVFCFVGRLNRDKGLSELIEAFSALNENARLFLVGSLDESAPIDPETLASIQRNPRVHQMGFLVDIRPVLAASSVLVLPSYREGFPNVVLQAGSMKLPVIATDINGSNEVIERGYNGWLVPARDSLALAGAMRDAMKLPSSTLERMGLQARSRICSRFEKQQHWVRMREFYINLLTKVETGRKVV